ncbi:MAG: polyprenyl synthetase family protein, partial [Candidatus Marinimicrobia bacterium]|nr:polyprenyl synthetase family protein [Candidatus Neomarinimicrobiota bacterium]
LGIVFQIQDDLLELTSSEDDMGKSLDSDIRAGKKTYPLIFAKEKAEKSNNLKFLALLNKKSYNNNEIKQLKENFADSDMIKLIEEKIHQDVIKLQHIADGLPDENKSLLLNFSQYILDRKK